MRPGPAPKPTRLKELAGFPGKRKENRREPRPPAGIPDRPEHLSGEGKAEWKRISKELKGLGLLTKLDRAALAAYCECWARWVEAEKFMQENGTVVVARDDKGVVKWTQPVPQMGIALKMLQQMRAFLVEFGLTPASRSRLAVEPTARNADPVEDFLKRKPGAVAETGPGREQVN